MIAKCYISQNLEKIDRLFQKAKSVQSGLFYCKLAILELGGWVEMSMDDIVRRHAKRSLQEQSSLGKMREVIKKTYGFDYEQHFKKMLLNIIGLAGIEKFEKMADSAKLQAMSAALNSLKDYRDKEAHEYTKGATRTLDAPSVTKNRFTIIYEGLVEIDRTLRKF